MSHSPFGTASAHVTPDMPSGLAGSAHTPFVNEPPQRRALATRASSGIGAGVAARLAAEGGWHISLSGRDTARLHRVAASMQASVFPADLTRPEAHRELTDFALGRAGRLDLLVACAVVGRAGDFTSMPRSAIDEVVVCCRRRSAPAR